MSWVKLDDHFPDHPKIAQAGPLGLAMQVAGLCYCNRYLTDGFIPKSAAKKLLDFEGIAVTWDHNEFVGGVEEVEWHTVVAQLVGAGVWREVEGGWQIHDYTEYQPSRSKVVEDRKAAKRRMEQNRKKGKTNGYGGSKDVRANN